MRNEMKLDGCVKRICKENKVRNSYLKDMIEVWL